MSDFRNQQLIHFVDWAAAHITGDEKGQAQIFLDRLFQAFGQQGSLDVGGSPEMRIKKSGEDGGGTSFADYVWKPVVLIEMKKRGVDLRKHFKQAFDYWVRLVPDRPRWVVLSNFDEFHIYDFDKQIDEPLDIVKLVDLPKRWGPLAFLFPTNEKPTFENDRTEVTREAADNLARCFNLLTHPKRQGGTIAPDLAQRFVLQMLVALFAYRAIKRLEGLIRERLTSEFPNEQPRLIHVNARQFYGMDVKEFAVELAKVSMMIGRKLAIDELHIIDEPPLPLDNLDENFRCVDALMSFTWNGTMPAIDPDDPTGGRPRHDTRVTLRTPWPEAHVIIENPPFLGAKRLKPERGADYVNALRKLYPEVPGMADYCVY